jgi:hypothetical protein
MFLDKNPVDNGGRENTAANRLRYILKHTMGADGAFEMRREELSMMRECGTEAVSDEDVVESYRDEVDPAKEGDNFMLKYLQQGKLAYVFGEHLFVHGAVNGANLGTVPGSTKRMVSSAACTATEKISATHSVDSLPNMLSARVG